MELRFRKFPRINKKTIRMRAVNATLISLSTYLTVHSVAIPLFTRFSKTFAAISLRERHEWCSRVVSSTHALISTLWCFYYIWKTPLSTEKTFYVQDIPENYHVNYIWAHSLGYVVYDFILYRYVCGDKRTKNIAFAHVKITAFIPI